MNRFIYNSFKSNFGFWLWATVSYHLSYPIAVNKFLTSAKLLDSLPFALHIITLYHPVSPCAIPRAVQFPRLGKLLGIGTDDGKKVLLSAFLGHPSLGMAIRVALGEVFFHPTFHFPPPSPPPPLTTHLNLMEIIFWRRPCSSEGGHVACEGEEALTNINKVLSKMMIGDEKRWDHQQKPSKVITSQVSLKSGGDPAWVITSARNARHISDLCR